ncbi:Kae1-associated serine/threonine protein kinase [Candidatus Woesearchaeota archaeon]|nr:Kae1-associated serine/threonine protein kinase [Candidatus Woesearchaeota archaeon]
MQKILAKGAEATITQTNNTITKERTPKKYRHPELDKELIKTRTKTETKIMQKIPETAPKLIKTENNKITMEYIEGKLLKEIIDKQTKLSKNIGETTAKLHDKNIIHGDLTTSNIILDKNKKIRIIDYGLSQISTKEEDKAVDLHLFKEAIKSKHYKNEKKIWKKFLEGYNPKNKEKILQRLKKVETRGRNKGK